MVYTGTHDNDTTVGWYASLPDHVRDFFNKYYPWRDSDVAWGLIRLAWSSVADLCHRPLAGHPSACPAKCG